MPHAGGEGPVEATTGMIRRAIRSVAHHHETIRATGIGLGVPPIVEGPKAEDAALPRPAEGSVGLVGRTVFGGPYDYATIGPGKGGHRNRDRLQTHPADYPC